MSAEPNLLSQDADHPSDSTSGDSPESPGASAAQQTGGPEPDRIVFHLSPLIRITLLGLYIALLLPVPILAQATAAPISPSLLALGLLAGGLLLYAALSEQVIVDDNAIQVSYPSWVPKRLRSGWMLHWQDITALKPRSTGQGGIVYYFVSRSSEQAYLLPMRVAGFNRLVSYIQRKTDIDTTDVRPLAQPWMYFILLGFTLLLALLDAWVIGMALSHQVPVPLP